VGSSAVHERLDLLYEMNRRLTQHADHTTLLQDATQRVRELFGADGCAVLLLDRDRRELYFPIVAESDPDTAARLGQARFPADKGIAGWILAHDEAVVVTDTRHDKRFYGGVDQQTHLQTRSLLGAPLRSEAGAIGVLEVVNPAAEYLGAADLQFLEAIAGDLALAYERTRLLAELRGEVFGLRQLLSTGGLVLAVSGVMAAAGAGLVHAARALPLAALPMRPLFLAGVLVSLIGLALRRVAQGWLVAPTRER